MTDNYIETHFDEIKIHSSDIESRLNDDCTIDSLKEDNRQYIEGFRRAGEQVVIIDGDYEQTIGKLLDS